MSAFEEVNKDLDYDVLIIGAGLSGLYSLHRMRQLGLRVKVLEAGEAEGGTWFWNRYPGARFDSESYSYIFSFSQELLDEWHWTEQFSPQPETLKYIQHFTRKFDLAKDIQFNTRIRSAHFQSPSNHWLLTDESDRTYTTRYLITAMGILNQPTLPDIPGVESFAGQAWHTARWPSDHSALAGKRVGIIGTGATAIQTIQEIYPMCGSLHIFQRTPNWTAPLRNSKINEEEMAAIRKRYPEIFQQCLESYSCFTHVTDYRKTTDYTREELFARWEELFQQPGFAKVLSVSTDIFTDPVANELYSDFHADKIRKRVNDPVLAEKLIPKNHGFGTRRVPLESGYYEAFNEPHVHLVDIREDPIQEITPRGVKTGTQEYELDVLIYATGFDAVTGSFGAVDFQGLEGKKLKDAWSAGIATFLGLSVKDFPNMFMIMGPHQMFGNIPRSIEYAVDWVADFIEWARDNKITFVQPTQRKMDAWYKHVEKLGEGLLANEVDSWMTGVNKNVKTKQKRSLTRYNGPAPGYRKECDAVKARNYSDFVLG
ncbi:hypothetical protein B0T14DRAFT_536772 [Immersiella caudata]|uniref:Uncharacterized protein n=1 Tax=Immersiella caudata TaxID=314043 RepID=A0AA40C407_9PEZI|nr:hypothetical protein B0T14DRAFT_536772 [Immersiella caudata]